LLVDVILRHDFIGAGRDGGRTHCKLCNPDNPDQILKSAAAQQISQLSQRLSPQPTGGFFAVMHVKLGRIHGEFLRLLFFLANKKADD
jgi:hypothetical protein